MAFRVQVFTRFFVSRGARMLYDDPVWLIVPATNGKVHDE